jgi:hypothetical protein
MQGKTFFGEVRKMSEQKKLKYQVQDGEAYYEVGINEDGELYAEKYFFPMPGWGNCYGETMYITTSTKRARASLEQWSHGYNAWGFGMDGSKIVSRKFIDLNQANQLREELLNIKNESDDLERLALALELAKKILNVMSEE